MTVLLRSPCYHCGSMFTPARPHQKHCRPSCRMAAFKLRQGQRGGGLFRESADDLFRVPFE